jgi:hypothetical protein
VHHDSNPPGSHDGTRRDGFRRGKRAHDRGGFFKKQPREAAETAFFRGFSAVFGLPGAAAGGTLGRIPWGSMKRRTALAVAVRALGYLPI